MTVRPGWVLSLSLCTEEVGHLVSATEVLARAAAGLALGGNQQVSVNITTVDIEEDDE